MGLAVRFHSIEPLSGFLLLPFVGYSVFGAALLNLSMHSSNAEVRASAASHKISRMWRSHIIFCRKVVCLESCATGHPSQGMAANPHHPANPALLRDTINPQQSLWEPKPGRMPHVHPAHAGGRRSSEMHWREMLQEGALPSARSGCSSLQCSLRAGTWHRV